MQCMMLLLTDAVVAGLALHFAAAHWLCVSSSRWCRVGTRSSECSHPHLAVWQGTGFDAGISSYIKQEQVHTWVCLQHACMHTWACMRMALDWDCW